MSIRALPEMPWIAGSLALDLANTIVLGAGPDGRDLDILTDPELAGTWAARAGGGRLVRLSTEERIVLRGLVREAFNAAAVGAPLMGDIVDRLNQLAASAPHVLSIDPHGELAWTTVAPSLPGEIAAETIRLATPPVAELLHRCPARSCGIFYEAARPDQRWCSPTCGSRGRAARRAKQAKAA